MKNMMNIFTFIASLTLSLTAFAGDTNGGSEVLPTHAASARPAPQGDCAEQERQIVSRCSMNPNLQNGLSGLNTMRNHNSGNRTDGGSATELQGAQVAGAQAKASMGAGRKECKEAGQTCQNKCSQEYNEAMEKYNAENQKKPMPNPDLLSQYQNEYTKAQQNHNKCTQEMNESMAKTGSSMAEIAQLLQAIAGLLQQLGAGNGEDQEVASAEDEEDKCDGPNASLILECSGQSDPIGSRAGVSGQTGVGDLSSGTGQSLFGQAAEADPGGDSDGSSKAQGAGFQNNGLGGGFGNSGFPGSGVSAASADKEKLNADIYKGYMGGGGSGGMGSFGGGGGGARSMGSRSKPFRPTSSGRKRLQSALDKVASAGGRAPASLDSKNGPYQNIWGVVTKTYKKTSPSMYHKE